MSTNGEPSDWPSRSEQTPEHHPTYNVHLKKNQIDAIIAAVLDPVVSASTTARDFQIEQLEHGKSFNNRIYKIFTSAGDAQKLVLKVSGQFFGPNKVQNEVACLSLLESHCPDVPVPRVFAWSEDGRIIQLKSGCKLRNDGSLVLEHKELPLASEDTSTHGWVLLTGLPGRTATTDDFLSNGKEIVRQLARWVIQWRSRMQGNAIGNVRLRRLEVQASSPGGQHSLVEVRGLLNCAHDQPEEQILSKLSFYKHMLRDALLGLENSPHMARNSDAVGSQVKEFSENFLAKIPFLEDRDLKACFSQLDLAPRNLLISDATPPTVTGILDFEFSGFFPAEDEFINNLGPNADDWPGEAHQIFMREMQVEEDESGVPDLESENFQQAATLARLIEHISPWWMPGQAQGTKLDEELDRVAAEVKASIEVLKKFVSGVDHVRN